MIANRTDLDRMRAGSIHRQHSSHGSDGCIGRVRSKISSQRPKRRIQLVSNDPRLNTNGGLVHLFNFCQMPGKIDYQTTP